MARETNTPVDNQAGSPTPGDGQPVRRSRLESRAERQSRREELRKQQRATSFRRKWLPWVLVALAAIVLIGALIMIEVVPKMNTVLGVEKFGGLSQDHVAGTVDYPQVPPVGGAHANTWWNCGVYDQPVPKEMAVHSMEHGAVWVTYRPDLPDDQVQKLRSLVRGNSYALLSPWTDPPLSAPIVASAWGLQIKADDANDNRINDFIRRYANGTQTPEKGAVCRGGAGQPIE